MTDTILMKLLVAFYLIGMSWLDIRKRRISWMTSGICFGAVVFLIFLSSDYSYLHLCGALVGIFVIVAALLTRGAVGMGDGVVFVMTGIVLGGMNLSLLFDSLLLAAVFSGILLALGKAKKKDSFPFIPFVCFSYWGIIIYEII